MTDATLLVIEDEPDLLRGLGDAFGFEGYRVLAAPTGEEGIARAAEHKVDLIILDLLLPDVNGYQVCEAIRRHDRQVPILMLSARSQEADKVRGFKVGADDYVTKPFGLAELLARVEALQRRSRRAEAPEEIITIGSCRVDLRRQTVTRVRDVMPLTVREAELLRLLYERQRTPVSRDMILDVIWGMDAMPTNRTVDNTVVKLRRKIEPDPRSPRHLLTVHGLGYKLVP